MGSRPKQRHLSAFRRPLRARSRVCARHQIFFRASLPLVRIDANAASSDLPNRAYHGRGRGGSGPGAASAPKALPARLGEPETGPKGAAAPGVLRAALEELRGAPPRGNAARRRSRTNACMDERRNRRRKWHRKRAGPGARTRASARGCGRLSRPGCRPGGDWANADAGLRRAHGRAQPATAGYGRSPPPQRWFGFGLWRRADQVFGPACWRHRNGRRFGYISGDGRGCIAGSGCGCRSALGSFPARGRS